MDDFIFLALFMVMFVLAIGASKHPRYADSRTLRFAVYFSRAFMVLFILIGIVSAIQETNANYLAP